MKRYLALLRTTWWLWLVFAAITVAGAIWFDPVFLAMVPISAFTFFWFAHVRFDANGERISSDPDQP